MTSTPSDGTDPPRVDPEVVDLGQATEDGGQLPVKFDPEAHDSKARQRIAYWMLAILSAVTIAPLFAWLKLDKPAAEVVDVGTKMLTPIVGLLGTVLGFYFASRKK